MRECERQLALLSGRQLDLGRLGLRVEPMPRPVDGEALLVQEITDSPDQQHFVMLVIAPVAAPLDRFELGELLLPITQHVRLHRTEIAHLANREIALGGDRRKRRFSSAVFRHGSRLRPWP